MKISKALREAGGAATEYRIVRQDLQLLRQVLELTQNLQPSNANAGHINALRGMALTCLVPLKEFAEKLESRYSSALSLRSTKGALSRSGGKVQWAVIATEEVSKLRAIIAAKIVTRSMLLGLCNR